MTRLVAPRIRHRQVSPERIAKVARALGASGVRLLPDGSAVVLTGDQALSLMPTPENEAESEWDRELGLQ